ncbi:MAG: hypothetical protein ACE5R6_14850 [Candidatus Heimdallarchaeota archaeon]
MKSKKIIIFLIIIIMGVMTISLALSKLVSNETRPQAQTTSENPQTTPIYITTTTPPVSPVKTIYLNNTSPAIPERFAAETSTFSQGIRLDVGVNDTTPRVGDAVLIVSRMTNVNSSEPVGFYGSLDMKVLNNESVIVYAASVEFLMVTIAPGYVELALNQTFTNVFVWKVETSPYINVEFKPKESYDIVVACGLRTRGAHRFSVSSTPIQVTISS